MKVKCFQHRVCPTLIGLTCTLLQLQSGWPAGGAAAKARAAQMQGFNGGGPNQMHQMMMTGGPETAEMHEAEAMAAAFRGVRLYLSLDRIFSMLGTCLP